MLGILLRIGLIAGVILLGACGGSSSTSKPDAPQAFNVTAGDGQVVVTWNMDSSLQYWIFLAQGSAISLTDYFNQPGARVVTPSYSPQIVNGLANGTQYAFLMNATRNGGPAGPTTPSIAVTPRMAGSSWTAGGVDVAGGLPSSVNFEAIAFGGGLFIAVGTGGAIYLGQYTGVGGITWTQETSNFPAGDLHGVSWTGTVFLAVGDGGNVDYSFDGVTWTVANTGTTQTLRASTVGGGYYIVVGDGGSILISTSLTSWTPVASGTANNLFGAANPGGNLAALGANGTFQGSFDAINWAPPATLPTVAATLRSETNGPTLAVPIIVVVGDNGTTLTSTDASHYALGAQPGGTTANLNSIAFGSQFVAVGAGGNIFNSVDGLNWSTAVSPVTQNINGIAFGNGAYVAVGDSGTNILSH